MKPYKGKVKRIPDDLRDERNTISFAHQDAITDEAVEFLHCAICDGVVVAYPGYFGRNVFCTDESHRTRKVT